MNVFDKFIKKIGYDPIDNNNLMIALTHSSYANENGRSDIQNEKFEFLGDSVLGFIVADHLFCTFPEKAEGELTRLRALIVCEKNLAYAARSIDLGKYIFLGKGETLSKGYEKDSILSDTLEALIGAIFLDKGIEDAKSFIVKYIIEKYFEDSPKIDKKDYKSLFQELMQKDGVVKIDYIVTDENGPDHNKTFFVTATVDGVEYGKGSGKSKKIAEQMAAKKALET